MNDTGGAAATRERRHLVGDLCWFGFPLRHGLPVATVADFELPELPVESGGDEREVHRLMLETCAKLLGARRPVIVPLSGGLDSRLVLATLLELLPASEIYCYTYGFREHLDFEIAPLVARAAGVHHLRRSFDEVPFVAAEVTALGRVRSLSAVDHFNLASHFYTRQITALCLAELPPQAPIWSGFLGDRLWSGRWLERIDPPLPAAAREYAAAYAHPVKEQVLRGRYEPAGRLLGLSRELRRLPGSSWCEQFDLQQRQYYVKRSLQVAAREYVFPLAAPELVVALLSLPPERRAQRRFLRQYLHRHHAALFGLPTTGAFGSPLRWSPARAAGDRILRLARERLERRLGRSLGRFAARRYGVELVEATWPEHRAWVRAGLEQARLALAAVGLDGPLDLDAALRDRPLSQQLASLGYLLGPSAAVKTAG